jgi:outer membrane protein
MYRSIFTIIMGLIIVQTSTAQTSFTLEAAKSYAYENNLRVTNSDLAVKNAIQQRNETRAIGLPQLEMNGSFNHFINLPVQVVDAKFFNPFAPDGETIAFRAGTKFNSSGTFQASQIVFNGSYIVGLQMSKFYIGLQEDVSRQTQEDVIFNVIQAYQYCAIAKENLRFIDSMVLITEELVKKQQNYFDLGLIIQEELDQLKFALQSTINGKMNAQLQYENSLTLLKMTMNYPMDQAIDISERPQQLINLQHSAKPSIYNNMNFILQQKQVTFSTYNLKNNQYAYLPSLNAFFQQTYNAFRNEFNFFADEKWYPQTIWGLQLSVPIFSSGYRQARVNQAKIRLMQEENNLKILEESLKMQEIQNKNNLLNAQNRLQLQQENVRLARSIYINSITREEIGKESSINVTQKYNQLLIAQSEMTGAMLDVLQAQLQLEKLYNHLIK